LQRWSLDRTEDPVIPCRAALPPALLSVMTIPEDHTKLLALLVA
jgi:hypothetical protein